MLGFENQEDFVEIELARQETDDLPSRGDAYLTIRVSADGFTGHNDLWVLAPVLRSFCRSLIALERDRRGEAVLESISLASHSTAKTGINPQVSKGIGG